MGQKFVANNHQITQNERVMGLKESGMPGRTQKASKCYSLALLRGLAPRLILGVLEDIQKAMSLTP
jgi:hypothetical protein